MPKNPNPVTSTRRTFIKAASVAALAAPVAPTILAAADKSGSKKPIVGTGAFKYEVTHYFGELPDHVQWGETHGVCVDREGLIYVKHRSHAATSVDAIVVFDAKGKFVRSFGKRFHHGGHGIDVRPSIRQRRQLGPHLGRRRQRGGQDENAARHVAR